MSIETVAGIHAVRALLERSPERVLELWLADGRGGEASTEFETRARAFGLEPRRVPRRTLDRHAGSGVRHQGVLARCRRARREDVPTLAALAKRHGDGLLVVALDGVEDPHNVGAIVRAAACFGAHAVVRGRSRGAALGPGAAKAAAGAETVVPLVEVPNLARALAELRDTGVRVVGAARDGEPLGAVDLGGPLALVLGGEHAGLRRLTREHCDALAAIPMPGAAVSDGVLDSLNVAMSAGVLLFEALRRGR